MLNGPPVWVLGACQPCIHVRFRAVVRVVCRDVLPWLKPGASQSTAAFLHRG